MSHPRCCHPGLEPGSNAKSGNEILNNNLRLFLRFPRFAVPYESKYYANIVH